MSGTDESASCGHHIAWAMSTRPDGRSGAASARRLSSASESWTWAGVPSACTTRHQGTGPPYVDITLPTWRGPPEPTAAARAPYVVTRPAGTCSTRDSTFSTYSSSTRATLRGLGGVAGDQPREEERDPAEQQRRTPLP